MIRKNEKRIKAHPAKGFSLIEVNLAILIAAGGLLSLFSLFPAGLRQSAESAEDLYQATRAAAVFDILYANASKITDESAWPDGDNDKEDIQHFWERITEGTGIETTGLKAAEDLTGVLKEDFDLRGMTTQDPNDLPLKTPYIQYIIHDKKSEGGSGLLTLPGRYIFRIVKLAGLRSPAGYRVSMVSTSREAPTFFHNNPVYTMDFYFMGKPWSVPE